MATGIGRPACTACSGWPLAGTWKICGLPFTANAVPLEPSTSVTCCGSSPLSMSGAGHGRPCRVHITSTSVALAIYRTRPPGRRFTKPETACVLGFDCVAHVDQPSISVAVKCASVTALVFQIATALSRALCSAASCVCRKLCNPEPGGYIHTYILYFT